MAKYVFLLLAAIVGWFLFKGLTKKSPPRDPGASQGGVERMVQCQLCGVHLPQSDTMNQDGKTVCRSPERCLRRESA